VSDDLAREATALLQFLEEISAVAANQPAPDVWLRHLRSGLVRLGFPSASIWLLDSVDRRFLRGTWGTNPGGAEVDEHTVRRAAGELLAFPNAENGGRIVVEPTAEPSVRARARLAFGDEAIGVIVVSRRGLEAINPALLAALALLADLTSVVVARGRAVEAAEQERRQTGLLLESTGEGIVGVDLAGVCTFVNRAAARILGYPAEELRGHHLESLVRVDEAGDIAPSPLTPTTPADLADISRPRVRLIRRHDGTVFPVEYVGHPVWDGDQLGGVVVVFRDVSDRWQLEEQLSQARRLEAIGQLAGGVAHDFNNLLTIIGGFCEFLADRLPPDSLESDAIAEIIKASETATALTGQLLAFGRRQIIAPREIDLNQSVKRLLRILGQLVGDQVSLRTILASDLGTVRMDAGQFDQILLNLVANARDAMPRGGTVIVDTANRDLVAPDSRSPGLPSGGYVVLTVHDTGVGMDEATRARIFEPFFTTKAPGRGTGLGLAAVYGIVKQSGGDIQVESRLASGTTFRILLPRVDEPRPLEKLPSQPPCPVGAVETILVVEDEKPVRVLTRVALEKAGYQVLEAANGAEALQVAEASTAPIHLVLTDIVLPGLSGHEVVASVRRVHPGARALYMSGYAENLVPRDGLEQSAPEFFAKPFTPQSLLERVRKILDQ